MNKYKTEDEDLFEVYEGEPEFDGPQDEDGRQDDA